MIKKLLLTFLLFTNFLFAYDTRLDNYPEAKEWLKDADTNGESAYNIGVLYHKHIKDNEKAIEWYKKASKIGEKIDIIQSANNLGYIYDDLKEYTKAIQWYKIASGLEDSKSTYNLGLL